jgi:predicted small secreted protein
LWFNAANRVSIMKREIVVIAAGILLISCILTSCDTPVGQGAAWGAATGAIIGSAATGHVRAASIARSRRSSRRGLNWRNDSRESSCTLWSAAARWLSIRALGWDAGFLLQSLYGARL